MLRIKVDSTMLNSIGYERGVLQVEFNTGTIYEYYEVPPEVFNAIVKADAQGVSVGQIFNKQVKLAGFKYERVG